MTSYQRIVVFPGFAAPAGGSPAKAELIAGLHMRGSRKWIKKGTDFELSDLTAPRYAELAEEIATQSNVLKALAEPNVPPGTATG